MASAAGVSSQSGDDVVEQDTHRPCLVSLALAQKDARL